MTDTLYKRINEPIFERRTVGPEGYEPWGMAPDPARPEGSVVLRSIGTMPQIVYIGPAEGLSLEFEPIIVEVIDE